VDVHTPLKMNADALPYGSPVSSVSLIPINNHRPVGMADHPLRHRSIVDFPAPLGPRITTSRPQLPWMTTPVSTASAEKLRQVLPLIN